MYSEESSGWSHVEGNWNQLRSEVTKAWGWLTDDECEEIRGRRDVLCGKVRDHYGLTQGEASRRIEEWVHNLKL